MKDLSTTSIKFILNILETTLKNWRKKKKKMIEDKNCNLKTYENLIDKCTELEYNIKEMEKHI